MRDDRQRRVEERPARIPFEGKILEADVSIPNDAKAIVLFAHGSGSSRFSLRNKSVARDLQVAGFATVLLDLLTPEEERAEALTRHLRFDIDMLSVRLATVTNWAVAQGGLVSSSAG